jgi:hypothetical protein
MRYVFAMIHAEQFLYCRKIKARRAIGLNVSPARKGWEIATALPTGGTILPNKINATESTN